MRESPKNERKHLPASTYEEWLKTQETGPESTKHRTKTVEDQYEAWIVKRVEKRVKRAGHRVKSPGR